ncbi:GNAT family N-acetyltransferase [Actinokineospora spheciospongiae]|uniref:GNAT family N-acetyltransferase n=1 Tax=Actinokineospora spheciospongiae TaxID=909613 RepID=UPI000D717D59|nr:GNAT family N-acetyltransferase [Actinokineospora spheciospongiae]
MSAVEVLDARFDAEPDHWPELTARAGLRADWSWPVLAAQAWAARVPQLVTVLHGSGGPTGVVASGFVGPTTRRHRFVGPRRAGGLGGLDVRAPGTSAVPGWWFDTDDGHGGVHRLLAEFLPGIRRELGAGVCAALLRQVPEEALPLLEKRGRLVRKTEPLAHLRAVGDRDAWLATLPRKRRQHLRRLFDTIDDDPTITVRTGGAVDPTRAAELLRVNLETHRDVPIIPLPQFTGQLTALLARPDVFTIAYTDPRDDTLLALGVLLDHPELPLARHWSALPEDEGGRPGLYFHFYGELMRWLHDTGRPRVSLGKKMVDLKRSMGAEFTDQYAAALPLVGLALLGLP